MRNKYHPYIFLFYLFFTINIAFSQQKAGISVLPKISVIDLNGKQSQLTTLGKDKVTLIACWFIPCPPCFSEMRVLHELYETYKTNPKLNFMTISRTDPSLVKKFINKDKSMENFTKMYEDFSGLKDFKLPVYFFEGCNEKIFTGVQLKNYKPDNVLNCPNAIFKFKGYPTLMIFDRTGKMIFSKTAYDASQYAAYKKQLTTILDKSLFDAKLSYN